MPVRTPKLDFSFLDQRSLIYQDRINRSRLLGDIAQGVIGAVQEGARYKRAQEVKERMAISKATAFDIKTTGDLVVDKKAIEEWKDIKEDFVYRMMTDKRPIVETDLIDFDATKQAFRIKLDAAKRVVGYALDAKKMMGDPKNKGLYDYRFDEFDNILYDLKNGNIELEDFVTFDWDKDYTAGKPFVDLHPIPPIELEVKTVSQFKKLTEEEKKRSLTTLKEGKEIKSSSDVKSYGDYDEFVDLVTNNILASDKSAWYAGWIINKLTPEQKIQAVNDYPFDDVSIGQMKYYYKNVANDVFEKHLAPDVVSGLDIRPEKISSSEKEKTIPMVNGSWDIRGNPQKFTGSEKEVYDSKGNRVNLTEKTAYITELKYGKIPGSKNTGLYVAMVISKKGGAYDDLIKRKQSGEIVGRDEWMAAYLNQSEKSQEVYIPYNKVKNVLKDYTFEGIDEFTLEKGDPLGIL